MKRAAGSQTLRLRSVCFHPAKNGEGANWVVASSLTVSSQRTAVGTDDAVSVSGRGAVAQGGGQRVQQARHTGEIERVVTAFARSPNGGLIVTAGGPALINRDLIITLAARHKLPAAYFDRAFVAAGGLLSYGPDRIDLYRRAAGYVDRILKGEKPADMPVQAPTKYQLVINLKTAKALGLDVPAHLQQIADEAIE